MLPLALSMIEGEISAGRERTMEHVLRANIAIMVRVGQLDVKRQEFQKCLPDGL